MIINISNLIKNWFCKHRMDRQFAPNGESFNFYGYGTGRVNVTNPYPPVNPLGGYRGSKL
jgi:hypothetical protein